MSKSKGNKITEDAPFLATPLPVVYSQIILKASGCAFHLPEATLPSFGEAVSTVWEQGPQEEKIAIR